MEWAVWIFREKHSKPKDQQVEKAWRQGSTWLVWGRSCGTQEERERQGIWKTEGVPTVFDLGGHGRTLTLTPGGRVTFHTLLSRAVASPHADARVRPETDGVEGERGFRSSVWTSWWRVVVVPLQGQQPRWWEMARFRIEGKNWFGGQIGCGVWKKESSQGASWPEPLEGRSWDECVGTVSSISQRLWEQTPRDSRLWRKASLYLLGSLLKPVSFRMCFLKDGTQKDWVFPKHFYKTQMNSLQKGQQFWGLYFLIRAKQLIVFFSIFLTPTPHIEIPVLFLLKFHLFIFKIFIYSAAVGLSAAHRISHLRCGMQDL